MLCAIILYTTNVTTIQLNELWFAQTLVHCASGAAVANRTEQTLSPFCDDKTKSEQTSPGPRNLATSISTAFGMFCQPALGALSDRIGRKPVLIIGAAGGVVTCALFRSCGSLLREQGTKRLFFLLGASWQDPRVSSCLLA